MKGRSLVTTLVVRLLLVGTVLTIANAGMIVAYYASDPEELRREKFDKQIDRLAKALTTNESGSLEFAPDAGLVRVFTAHPDAYAFRIVVRGKVIGEANSALLPDDRWSGVDGPDAWLTTQEVGGRKVAVGSRLVERNGEKIRFSFAASGDPSNLFRFVYYDELFVHIVIALLPFVAVLLTFNVLTVRRSLHPLVHAAAVARAAGPAITMKPLPAEGLPSEVLALVEATNDALHRLQLALEAEKAFTAEAAHALRTPLAVLSARIEALPSTVDLSPVKADIRTLSRLTNQLLSAAQADTLVVDAEQHCDLSDLAAKVVAGLAPIAIREGRALALEAAAGVAIRGDADALAHALRNLVENALRFSPRGTEVLVTVSADGVLSVLDRGPGIPEADKPLLTRRFWRRSASGLAGTGLGLSIVHRIAEAHRSQLQILDRPGGGAIFRLCLDAIGGRKQPVGCDKGPTADREMIKARISVG